MTRQRLDPPLRDLAGQLAEDARDFHAAARACVSTTLRQALDARALACERDEALLLSLVARNAGPFGGEGAIDADHTAPGMPPPPAPVRGELVHGAPAGCGESPLLSACEHAEERTLAAFDRVLSLPLPPDWRAPIAEARSRARASHRVWARLVALERAHQV